MKSGLECLKLLDVVIDFVDLCSDINPNVSNNAEIREIRRLIVVFQKVRVRKEVCKRD